MSQASKGKQNIILDVDCGGKTLSKLAAIRYSRQGLRLTISYLPAWSGSH